MSAIFTALLAALANPAVLAALFKAGPELISLAFAVVNLVKNRAATSSNQEVAALGLSASQAHAAMVAVAAADADHAQHLTDDGGYDPGLFRD